MSIFQPPRIEKWCEKKLRAVKNHRRKYNCHLSYSHCHPRLKIWKNYGEHCWVHIFSRGWQCKGFIWKYLLMKVIFSSIIIFHCSQFFLAILFGVQVWSGGCILSPIKKQKLPNYFFFFWTQFSKFEILGKAKIYLRQYALLCVIIRVRQIDPNDYFIFFLLKFAFVLVFKIIPLLRKDEKIMIEGTKDKNQKYWILNTYFRK